MIKPASHESLAASPKKISYLEAALTLLVPFRSSVARRE
jgi:hypothetical protein